MTNTYNTLNPLGSTSPKDLYDNASNFDEGMNSLSPSFYDRFLRRRETWAGMEKQVSDFLIAMGFEPTHLVYIDGTPLTVSRPTQLIDRAGSTYMVKQPASFPVNLTGTWATDSASLVEVGDAVLRQDLANSSDATKGSALVGYKRNVTGATGRTVSQKLAESVSVKDFGALGNGLADDTAAFQAALSAAGTFSVFVPAGTYILSAGLTLGHGQSLLGESSAVSILKTTQTTGDVITMAGFGSRVENMQFDAIVVRTAGRFINSAVARTYIRNIEIYNYFIGIGLSNAYTYVENISINTCSVNGDGYGIHIYGGNDQFIRNVIVDNTAIKSPFAGLYITQCGGAKIASCDFIRCKVSVYMNALDGTNVSAIDCTDIWSDTAGNNAYIMSCTGTGWMYYNTFTNCWAASSVNFGWQIGGGTGMVDGVFMVNTRSINNGLHGISIGTNVRNVTMNGGQVGGNSQATPNTSAGVFIDTNTSDITINGMRIGGPVQNFADHQKYGISVGTGAGDRIIITNNNLFTTNAGAGAQPLIFGATGPSNVIDMNAGVITRGFFAGTTDGSGNVVVPHLAGFVPKGVITSNMNNVAAQFCQPDAPNASTFRVNFRDAAGVALAGIGVNFAWHILS